ncbi:MAG: hypothetical protein L6Q83_06975, partial [Gammaproteobacteria bacterium]|nr:hypothetical protein [Gammaproteobacteria bacterium]
MGRGNRRLTKSRDLENGNSQSLVSGTEAKELAVRRLVLRTIACTGAAVSAIGPAHALSVGEITVESLLGQPLSAKVPVEL